MLFVLNWFFWKNPGLELCSDDVLKELWSWFRFLLLVFRIMSRVFIVCVLRGTLSHGDRRRSVW